MTRNRNRNNNSLVGLQNGSMAVAKQAAKVKNVTRKRWFMSEVASLLGSAQVLSQSQSPYAVGSQYATGTFTYSISQLGLNARDWVASFDRYRILAIEVFATLVIRSRNNAVDRNAPVQLYFYEDTDCDSSVQTSWIRVRDRENLGKVVLTALHPSQRLITFTPTGTFSAGNSSQDPANKLPQKSDWFDALALSQQFAGLRVFAACPQYDTSGQSYEFDVVFDTRYHVEVTQPL